MLVGLDTVRAVAARGDVAILSHPSFAGTLLQRRHGIAPEGLFGVMMKLNSPLALALFVARGVHVIGGIKLAVSSTA